MTLPKEAYEMLEDLCITLSKIDKKYEKSFLDRAKIIKALSKGKEVKKVAIKQLAKLDNNKAECLKELEKLFKKFGYDVFRHSANKIINRERERIRLEYEIEDAEEKLRKLKKQTK